jgi:CheY-like chemotaxis protein
MQEKEVPMLSIKKTVAIVDDDEVFQFIIDKTIRRVARFTNIFTFSNGKQAIDHMDSFQSNEHQLPDVIFLDINMPVSDGWQFLENYLEKKHTYSKKPLIYMVSSSYNREDIDRASLYQDIYRYHTKPVSIEKMKQIVLELL